MALHKVQSRMAFRTNLKKTPKKMHFRSLHYSFKLTGINNEMLPGRALWNMDKFESQVLYLLSLKLFSAVAVHSQIRKKFSS